MAGGSACVFIERVLCAWDSPINPLWQRALGPAAIPKTAAPLAIADRPVANMTRFPAGTGVRRAQARWPQS